jgi:hypothetical protein
MTAAAAPPESASGVTFRDGGGGAGAHDNAGVSGSWRRVSC